MYFPVDCRSKLNPPLPPGYLGNAVFIAAVITEAGDLKTESFPDTVKRIHEGLSQINDEYLRSALDYTEKVSDLSALISDGVAPFLWDQQMLCKKAKLLYSQVQQIMGGKTRKDCPRFEFETTPVM
ncbi:hypothetical protein V6N13_083425 [Hibiscus sabdariffa]|uniref:Uncharacterized protein n=1 Tax=Hibiscus sabdariffa TaxID=183260 RepID=A0ABR2SY60_9ROSI